MPCRITILRALGLAQYGTLYYLRKDCSKSNKTTRIYRFFKFFLPRHLLSPRNLLLPPVVLVVLFWYAIKYLKVSHFSFPSTSILHECTVNNEGKYFSTHKIIRKNLQAIVSHIRYDITMLIQNCMVIPAHWINMHPELTISKMTLFGHMYVNSFRITFVLSQMWQTLEYFDKWENSKNKRWFVLLSR